MERLIFLLTTGLVVHISGRRFKRYYIGHTGCSTRHLSGEFTTAFTTAGDKVFFNEVDEKDVTYGFVCVQMKDVSTMNEAYVILLQYLGNIQKPFGIIHDSTSEYFAVQNLGPMVLEDYWQDENGKDWKVKAYTNGQILAVLYVKNISKSKAKDEEKFLNSFRFS